MVIVPKFYELDKKNTIMKVFVGRTSSACEELSSQAAIAAAGVLKYISRKGFVAGSEYFTRAWTLAERMARNGREERLCQWMSLEVWLGMLVDVLQKGECLMSLYICPYSTQAVCVMGSIRGNSFTFSLCRIQRPGRQVVDVQPRSFRSSLAQKAVISWKGCTQT